MLKIKIIKKTKNSAIASKQASARTHTHTHKHTHTRTHTHTHTHIASSLLNEYLAISEGEIYFALEDLIEQDIGTVCTMLALKYPKVAGHSPQPSFDQRTTVVEA